MKFDNLDLYAALMHELKNNLGLLIMTLDSIPLRGDAEHDGRLDDARLLSQRSVERLQQALLIYKADTGELHPVVDAYSPLEMLRELRDTAQSLAHSRSRLRLEADMVDGCLAFTLRDDSDGYPAHILEYGTGGNGHGSAGTGLGLRFARLIAEAHDNNGRTGELRLFNEDGAVFRFLLP